jgi:hypothetical protein
MDRCDFLRSIATFSLMGADNACEAHRVHAVKVVCMAEVPSAQRFDRTAGVSRRGASPLLVLRSGDVTIQSAKAAPL